MKQELIGPSRIIESLVHGTLETGKPNLNHFKSRRIRTGKEKIALRRRGESFI